MESSFIEKMKALLLLLRPPYWLMTGGLSILTMFTLQKGSIDPYLAVVTFISVISITSAGFAFNDYIDQEADAISKKKRPIPSGRIAPQDALIVSVIMFTIGLLVAFSINLLCFGIALVNSVLLVLYSLVMKRAAGFLGNFLIGMLIGTSFVYGEAALLGVVTFHSFSLTFMSMGSIGGNILRDVLSLEGDEKTGYSTFAIKYGPEFATKVGAILFLLHATASPTPFLTGAVGYAYLFPVLIWDAILIYSAYSLLKRIEIKEAAKQERLVTMTHILIPIALIAGALT